ncbi:MAG: AAA family ATPase [Candidatus Falkowbacteria bacterium]
MKRGIVIGKFYPPHRGHKYLIDFATRNVDRLTVIVCHRADQIIPGTQRAEWIREIHPDAEVLVVDDIMKDDDSRAWAEYTKKFLGYIPDAVFTSEDYGDTYAACLGCRHIIVDKERKNVPIRATDIRNDPIKHWEFLEPCVKAHFAKRICVIGAESTGTTMLARSLAEYYRTVWVPEFGRMYSEAKGRPDAALWRTDEFTFIASAQNRMEDFLARQCNKILICDTDSFATSLWHERYLGCMSRAVEKISAGRKYDLYILTGDEIPFIQDGTRDGEHIRHAMHKRFEEELRKSGKPFLTLRGSHETRMKTAKKECDKIISPRLNSLTNSVFSAKI